MSKFQEFKEKVASLDDHAEKFYDKEVKAAGTRLRKGLQEVKKLIKEVRAEVAEKKALLTTKEVKEVKAPAETVAGTGS